MGDFETPRGEDRIEQLLRRSLQARADDVRPAPATWQKVSRGVRRGRILGWTLAGVGAVGAVVLAAVVLPGLLNRSTVDFDDSFGERPDGMPRVVDEPGDGPACGGPQHVSAVLARDGDELEGTVWALCDDGSESLLDPARPADAVDRNPTLSWDAQSLVFERIGANGVSLIVHVDMRSGQEQVLMGGSAPVFSSDGRLAWVQRVDQGQDRILVGRLFSEPELEFPVVDGEDGEWFEVVRLAFDASGQTLYASVAADDTQLLSYDVGALLDPSGDGDTTPTRLVEPNRQERYVGPGAAHQPGAVSVVARCCAAGPGDPFSRAELRILVDGDVERAVELPGGFDVDGAAWSTWAPMGPLRTTRDGVTAWNGGSRAGYLVGDGSGLWAVEPDGNTRLVTEGVRSAAANPALTAEGPVAGGSGGGASDTAPPQDGLTDEAAATRDRVWRAAKARDFDALHAEMNERFTASFGGEGGADEAIALLREMEQRGEDPFGLILRLLATRHASVQTEGGPSPIYTWPAVHARPAQEWDEQDEAELRGLGSDDDIVQWRRYGSYLGWRIGIDAAGNWLYLVAGD